LWRHVAEKIAVIENRLVSDFVMIKSLPQGHIFKIDGLDI